jgi:antitoxin component YwqK of YwqJK toxin-antitoxin module
MKTDIDFYHKDGQEIEYYDSTEKIKFESYHLNGELHREDGPAVIYYYENGRIGTECYYKNGKYHREDGPALIHYDESGDIQDEFFYLNGVEYPLAYTDEDIIMNWEAFCKMQLFR